MNRRFFFGCLVGGALSGCRAAATVPPVRLEQFASAAQLQHDAAPAIRAALATGRPVAAHGRYNIRSRLDVKSGTIDFSGATITFTGWSGSNGGIGTPPAASYAFLLRDGAHLIGGTFEGQNLVGCLIRISGSNVRIENLIAREFCRYGIAVQTGNDNVIERCTLEDFGAGQPPKAVINGIFIAGTVANPSLRNIIRGCSIRRMNYEDWRVGKNDSNGIQILGDSAPNNMDPDSPEFSDAVLETLITDCQFEDIDRRAVKIQESYTTVQGCLAVQTGGIRPVGGSKKIKGLRIINNNFVKSLGFAINSTLIDSEFRGNKFREVSGTWWSSYSGGLAVRCVIADNIIDADSLNPGNARTLSAGAIAVGQFNKDGRYDRDLIFRNNRFSRIGRASLPPLRTVGILVARNAKNIVIEGNEIDFTSPHVPGSKILSQTARLTSNRLPSTR